MKDNEVGKTFQALESVRFYAPTSHKTSQLYAAAANDLAHFRADSLFALTAANLQHTG